MIAMKFGSMKRIPSLTLGVLTLQASQVMLMACSKPPRFKTDATAVRSVLHLS